MSMHVITMGYIPCHMNVWVTQVDVTQVDVMQVDVMQVDVMQVDVMLEGQTCVARLYR